MGNGDNRGYQQQRNTNNNNNNNNNNMMGMNQMQYPMQQGYGYAPYDGGMANMGYAPYGMMPMQTPQQPAATTASADGTAAKLSAPPGILLKQLPLHQHLHHK